MQLMPTNTSRKFLLVFGLTLAIFSCKTKDSSEQTATQTIQMVAAPTFNADSAYAFVERQVAFGPRVPNTIAHEAAGDYLVRTLEQYGFTVTEQKFTVTTYDGQRLNARNIIGSYQPQAAKRIMLAAHWDSRPYSDQDSTRKTLPVIGANDGGSGVGILLEVARTLHQSQNKPDLGIDIFFFDAEDWGSSSSVPNDKQYGGFALGSRHWAADKHVPGYSAYFGILLDMVGAKGATFLKEGHSTQYASEVVRTVWNTAGQLGYGNYFIDQQGPSITDDHVPVNEVARIPMIDIIHTRMNDPNRTFFDDWHTAGDDMKNIDPNTLKAVGQTLIQVVYNESQPGGV